MFHDTEEWCKIWRKTDSWFQKRHEEYDEFSPNHSKVQKFYFNGLFLSKVLEVSATETQRVIFHDTEQWCKICINPDHVVSKMTWGIEWTFITALKVWKIVHWWAYLVQSIWCFSQKILEELCVMTLNGDAKFNGKLTCGLKNDVRNLVNFHASSRKSGNFHFYGLLLSKAYKDLDEKVQKSYESWD